jgi:hypothetical protein
VGPEGAQATPGSPEGSGDDGLAGGGGRWQIAPAGADGRRAQGRPEEERREEEKEERRRARSLNPSSATLAPSFGSINAIDSFRGLNVNFCLKLD